MKNNRKRAILRNRNLKIETVTQIHKIHIIYHTEERKRNIVLLMEGGLDYAREQRMWRIRIW